MVRKRNQSTVRSSNVAKMRCPTREMKVKVARGGTSSQLHRMPVVLMSSYYYYSPRKPSNRGLTQMCPSKNTRLFLHSSGEKRIFEHTPERRITAIKGAQNGTPPTKLVPSCVLRFNVGACAKVGTVIERKSTMEAAKRRSNPTGKLHLTGLRLPETATSAS